MENLTRVAHPLYSDETIAVPPSWAWQEGERRLYTVYYAMKDKLQKPKFDWGTAWAYTPEEAVAVVKEALQGVGWQMLDASTKEHSPLCCGLNPYGYRTLPRYQEGQPLTDLPLNEPPLINL